MANKVLLVLGAIVAFAACQVLAVEYIELNDANKNELLMDKSYALRIVQEAMQSGYNFSKVSDAMRFLDQCSYLKSVISSAADTDFKGLAGKIKALLADEVLSKKCIGDSDKLSPYFKLDEKLGEFAYLSHKKFDEFVALAKSLEENPDVKDIIQGVFDARVQEVVSKLLKEAGNDSVTLFGDIKSEGFLGLDNKHMRGCSISALKPICKFARSSQLDNVSAIGRDFSELAKAIQDKDQEKLASAEKLSGVSMETVKDICKQALKNLGSMERVDDYKSKGWVSQSDLESQMADGDFDFSYNLYHLCLVV